MLLQNCQQLFCYGSIEEKYLLRKELILSLHPEILHLCEWKVCSVYMEESLFLINSPDDKLIRVLWNIYLSLACCEPDFSHKEYNYQKLQSRHIFNKSPSFPQRSSQTLHLGGKKLKIPPIRVRVRDSMCPHRYLPFQRMANFLK